MRSDPDIMRKLADTTGGISALKLGALNEAQFTEDLVQCGFDKATATFNTSILPADLDPNQDAILQEIFPAGQLDERDYEKAAASLKKLDKNGDGELSREEYAGLDRN